MTFLNNQFNSKQELIEYVKKLSNDSDQKTSEFVGSLDAAYERLEAIDPIAYGRTRNFLDGKVTRLSPYISRGLLSLKEVAECIKAKLPKDSKAIKLLQELAWREYWDFLALHYPHWLYEDAGPYKTGFSADEYQLELPVDIEQAQTPNACINAFILDLYEQGHVHNHARMYLASYVVHYRKVKWQAGAKWFMSHLLDHHLPSNQLSWQWVASTLSTKPYIFNLSNIQKYASDALDVSEQNNPELNRTYDQLHVELFPNL